MKYPLVPLVTELTFPLLFFWFCLPFVMLLIVMIIWLQLLLNEAQMPSAEEMKTQTSDKPDSDSNFDDGSTEEESQNETSSIGMQEEIESSGSGKNLSPRPAYLSSNAQSQQQSLFTLLPGRWFRRQKIRYSPTSNFCGIVTLLFTMLSSFTCNVVCHLLQISNILRIQLMQSSLFLHLLQLFAFLGEKAVRILGSLGLERRGLLASVLGRRLKQ